jgi:hypothetical protein
MFSGTLLLLSKGWLRKFTKTIIALAPWIIMLAGIESHRGKGKK